MLILKLSIGRHVTSHEKVSNGLLGNNSMQKCPMGSMKTTQCKSIQWSPWKHLNSKISNGLYGNKNVLQWSPWNISIQKSPMVSMAVEIFSNGLHENISIQKSPMVSMAVEMFYNLHFNDFLSRFFSWIWTINHLSFTLLVWNLSVYFLNEVPMDWKMRTGHLW